MNPEKIIAFLLLILYILTFGRKSLLKYLEGGVSINIREEVLKNVEPPGKCTIHILTIPSIKYG